MSASLAPLAYIDTKRRLSVIEADGRVVSHTMPSSDHMVWGDWTTAPAEGAHWSWPTWSPDGSRIACYRTDLEPERVANVVVVERGGVSGTELCALDRRLPIYLYWSPDGSRLAILSQRDEDLVLSTASESDVGHEKRIATGSPLFFTWAGDRLAAFVGNGTTRGGRMALLDPRGLGHEELLPGVPSNFCAPVWLEDRLMYVAWHGGRTALCTASAGDAEPRTLETVDGLVALVARPDRQRVARAVAPEGDGTPYRHLAIVHPTDGRVAPIEMPPCLAFVWAGNTEGIVLARVDTDRNLLEWSLLHPDGRTQRLIDMYPTRDLGFYLRFFEQYAQSHPIVDPTGRYLVLGGRLHGRASGDAPRIWRIDLRTGDAEDLAEGVFAVYGPEPAN